MSKKKPTSPPIPPMEPSLFEATLGGQGSVIRGAPIDRPQAEARRRAGLDVVVCGPDLKANRNLARAIEGGAKGDYSRHDPHRKSGPKALPHCQPSPRPPAGHTFYETPYLKAF